MKKFILVLVFILATVSSGFGQQDTLGFINIYQNGCNNRVIAYLDNDTIDPVNIMSFDFGQYSSILSFNLDGNINTVGPFLIEYSNNVQQTIQFTIVDSVNNDIDTIYTHITSKTFTPGIGIALNTQIAQFDAITPNWMMGFAWVNYQGSSDLGPSDSFTWNFDGGNIESGSGSGPYTISWNSIGRKMITLTVSNTTGCASMIRIIDYNTVPTNINEIINIREIQPFYISNNTVNFPQNLLGFEYKVYDICGKLVLQDKVRNTNTELSLVNGMYVLFIDDKYKKFLIN